MTFMFRFLITGAVLGSLSTTAKPAKEAAEKAIEMVKATVTTYELSSICDFIQNEFEIAGHKLKTGDDKALADFIHEFMRVKGGGRDPAIDLWGNPYHFDNWKEKFWYVLYSAGTNGQKDECSEQSESGDDVCAWIQMERSDSVYKSLREEEAY
jgi:hypothetical protein